MHAGFGNCCGVKAPELCSGVTGIEQPGIEKVRTDTAGLQGKFAKSQNAEFQRKFDELSLVRSHALLFPRSCLGLYKGFCMMAAADCFSVRSMTQEYKLVSRYQSQCQWNSRRRP